MTTASPLHYRTLAETVEDIRGGALSSEEVTRHTLDRIAELEPRLHAFAELRAESALREARAADAGARAGKDAADCSAFPRRQGPLRDGGDVHPRRRIL